jgi:hypothetical protein
MRCRKGRNKDEEEEEKKEGKRKKIKDCFLCHLHSCNVQKGSLC